MFQLEGVRHDVVEHFLRHGDADELRTGDRVGLQLQVFDFDADLFVLALLQGVLERSESQDEHLSKFCPPMTKDFVPVDVLLLSENPALVEQDEHLNVVQDFSDLHQRLAAQFVLERYLQAPRHDRLILAFRQHRLLLRHEVLRFLDVPLHGFEVRLRRLEETVEDLDDETRRASLALHPELRDIPRDHVTRELLPHGRIDCVDDDLYHDRSGDHADLLVARGEVNHPCMLNVVADEAIAPETRDEATHVGPLGGRIVHV
mmetsp:Transcript_40312/g.111014  ORF Transcript_40312/g.111014 Transcript_40312/m.111014 type:complete len:260 (-) Transcript_40312:1938-2717(-)